MKMKRTRYILYIARMSYKDEYKPKYIIGYGDMAPVWQGTTLAYTRTGAVKNLLADMQSEQGKLLGKYVSVFVGTRVPESYPGRLWPIQVVIVHWTIRDTQSLNNQCMSIGTQTEEQ